MPDDTGGTEDMRRPADWMGEVDDRILELVRERGNLTPKVVSEEEVSTQKYASLRMRVLAEAGLLERVHENVQGLYGITDTGLAYLDEEFDARPLPMPEIAQRDAEDHPENGDSDSGDGGNGGDG